MPSIERSVKDEFATIFSSSDWKLFKQLAEINFAEAAKLKKASFAVVARDRRLLVRNARKRLLIGIGAELLLKSIYLKLGYGINKPKKSAGVRKPPFKFSDVEKGQLDPNDTFTLSELIEQLGKVVQLSNLEIVLDGLRIAKVFRNKEAHVVTGSHKYNASTYRSIETALVEVYSCAFGEKLAVRFSFEPREKGVWCLGH